MTGRQRGGGRAQRGLRRRPHDRDRHLRRLRRDRPGGRPCTSTRPHGHRAALPGLRRRAAAAGPRRDGEMCLEMRGVRRAANRRSMTRSALPRQDAARPSPGWRARSASANGARSAADSTPPIVGLMKPSRSEPIATWSGPIASMWRSSTASDSRERLRVRPAHAVVELVLGEDQPDHAAARDDPRDRPVGEVVALAAEAVAGVRGDHGIVRRVGAGLAVERLDELERRVDRVLAHVADVDAARRSRTSRARRPRPAATGPACPSAGTAGCRARRAGTAARARSSPPGARTGARA